MHLEVYSSSQQLTSLASHIEKLCEMRSPEPLIMTKPEIATRYITGKRWNTIF